jgi:hypothetical protein
MSTIGNVGKNVSIRYKVESTFGTPVTGGSGEEFRFHEGAPGLAFTRGLVEDPESRNDGQRSQMRLGSHKVGGSLPGTLSVGTFNTLLGALFRNTFTAAATLLTCDGGGDLYEPRGHEPEHAHPRGLWLIPRARRQSR